MVNRARLRPLPLPCEQPASSWWGGAPATGRPARGVDGQHHGTRCLEGHHALGAQRVHLLGRGCQAADDPRTPHSPDTGGAGGWPAPALLLAGMQAPRPRRQVARRNIAASTENDHVCFDSSFEYNLPMGAQRNSPEVFDFGTTASVDWSRLPILKDPARALPSAQPLEHRMAETPSPS